MAEMTSDQVKDLMLRAHELSEVEARGLLDHVEKHDHDRRASRHALAMAHQSGDPKIIEKAKEDHAATMDEVAKTPFTRRHIDFAAQALLNAQGYAAPQEK